MYLPNAETLREMEIMNTTDTIDARCRFIIAEALNLGFTSHCTDCGNELANHETGSPACPKANDSAIAGDSIRCGRCGQIGASGDPQYPLCMECWEIHFESDIILRRVLRNSDEHLAKFGTGQPAPKVDKYCTECGARFLATDRTECDCGSELS